MIIANTGSAELQQMAGLEYRYLEDQEGGLAHAAQKISPTGALPCFCEQQHKEGFKAD